MIVPVAIDLLVGAVALYGFTRTGEPWLLLAFVFVLVELAADVRRSRRTR